MKMSKLGETSFHWTEILRKKSEFSTLNVPGDYAMIGLLTIPNLAVSGLRLAGVCVTYFPYWVRIPGGK